MRAQIIGLGHLSSAGCVGQTRDRGYQQGLSVWQKISERNLDNLDTVGVESIFPSGHTEPGTTLVPGYFVNNPCSAGTIEEERIRISNSTPYANYACQKRGLLREFYSLPTSWDRGFPPKVHIILC